jgi:hypothetical protein
MSLAKKLDLKGLGRFVVGENFFKYMCVSVCSSVCVCHSKLNGTSNLDRYLNLPYVNVERYQVSSYSLIYIYMLRNSLHFSSLQIYNI